MSTFFLGGGGREEAPAAQLYRPFVAAAATIRPSPRIAVVLLDEGDGEAECRRFAALLRHAGECEPVPVLLEPGASLQAAALDDTDALFCGAGLTPGYAEVVSANAEGIRAWLHDGGRPYAGFSAGSAVAADRALVGGWRLGDAAVCPDDAGEGLDQVTITDGLGLVDVAIDVHCAQWGTLSRLVASVAAGQVDRGVGIDEHTMLVVDENGAVVTGAGAAWVVTPADDEPSGVTIRRAVAGERVPA